MEHREVIDLLDEYLLDRLPEDRVVEIRAHLEGCSECRDVYSAGGKLQAQMMEHGEAFFSNHPESEELVTFAQDPAMLLPARRMEVEAHLVACPVCHQCVEMTRGANQELATEETAAPAIGHRMAERSAVRRFVLWPAVAAAATLLLTIGFEEFIRIPNITTANDKSVGVVLAFLPDQQRDPGSHSLKIHLTTVAPRIALMVPFSASLVVDPLAPVELSIARIEDGRRMWVKEAQIVELWNPAYEALGVLIPVGTLVAGEYRVEVRFIASGDMAFSSTLQVSY